MSNRLNIKIATLRFLPDGESNQEFDVKFKYLTLEESVHFIGAGQVEMGEASLDVELHNLLNVTVSDSTGIISTQDIPIQDISATSDWTIVQLDKFEVRVQLILVSQAPSDFIENTLIALSGPKAWYFKAEDIYAVLKTAVRSLQFPQGEFADRVAQIVDLITEAFVKKFAQLTLKEEVNILKSLDDILTVQLTNFDLAVDNGRHKLVESLRKLRLSVQVSIQYHYEIVDNAVRSTTEKIQSTVQEKREFIDAQVQASKEITANTVKNVTDSIDNFKVHTNSSFEEAKQRLHILTEESKQWAREFLQARIIQGQDTINKAHPYVLHAVDISQPYAAKVASVATPYVNLALPYVTPILSEAKRIAEENQFVGPYVAPTLDKASQIVEEAKVFLGVDNDYLTVKTDSETITPQSAAVDPVH